MIPSAPYRSDRSWLQPQGEYLLEAEDLGLDCQAEDGDFVAKEDAVLRHLKKPGLVLDGTQSKGAFDMTEKFAFEQVFGQGGAVDGDNGLLFEASDAINHSGIEFFARTVFVGPA